MTDDDGPTLSFPGWAWALLRDKGNLSWPHEGDYVFLAGATTDRKSGETEVVWALLPWDARRDLYQALVRATARCHERRDRQWFADVLHRLGYELIPEEGDASPPAGTVTADDPST